MPKLLAVRYRLFEFEESAAIAAANDETHHFNGELVLSFEDSTDVFVSWVNAPVQHSIGTQSTSYFISDATLTDHDVSGTGMWSGLVGHDVSLEFVAPDNQILAVASSKDRLLLCSFERGHWWADVVAVCRESPAAYVALGA